MLSNRLNYILLSIVAIVLSVAIHSCTGVAATADNSVMVSIEPLRGIAQRIAGDGFEVATLMESGANPETFEPSMSKRMQLERARSFIVTGLLPFEQTLVNDGDLSAVSVIDVSQGIDLIYGTHEHLHAAHGEHSEHGHADCGSADPHIWMSLRNLETIARNIAAGLSEIDPEHAADYQARGEALVAELQEADNKAAALVSTARVKSFAVWHPSLSYFARDYGLEQIPVGSETKEASVGRLRGVIDEAVADSVRVFFFQREYDTRQAQSVCERIGSRMVTIDVQSSNIVEQLSRIADELAHH